LSNPNKHTHTIKERIQIKSVSNTSEMHTRRKKHITYIQTSKETQQLYPNAERNTTNIPKRRKKHNKYTQTQKETQQDTLM